jgi:S-adenosylmethionine hydrolase
LSIEEFGDILTNFTADDLDRIGTRPGDPLQIQIGGHSYPASYRTTFAGVNRGDWIAIVFPDPEFEAPAVAQGCVSIARKFENAAAAASAKVGDEIVLVKVTNP